MSIKNYNPTHPLFKHPFASEMTKVNQRTLALQLDISLAILYKCGIKDPSKWYKERDPILAVCAAQMMLTEGTWTQLQLLGEYMEFLDQLDLLKSHKMIPPHLQITDTGVEHAEKFLTDYGYDNFPIFFKRD